MILCSKNLPISLFLFPYYLSPAIMTLFPIHQKTASLGILHVNIPNVSLPISIKEDGELVFLYRDIKDNTVSHFHFFNKANVRPSPISLEYAFNLFCKGTMDLYGIISWEIGRKAWKDQTRSVHQLWLDDQWATCSVEASPTFFWKTLLLRGREFRIAWSNHQVV